MATILVVDDVQTDRELLGKVVLKAGHTPIYASDGAQAYEMAKAQKPALIFLDVVMPGQDGFKACRVLKQDPATKTIPTVLVTSKSTDSDKFWGRKQGADGHVAKPFTPDGLTVVLRAFVP